MIGVDGMGSVFDVECDVVGEWFVVVCVFGFGVFVLVFDVGGIDIKFVLFDVDGMVFGLCCIFILIVEGDCMQVLFECFDVFVVELWMVYLEVVLQVVGFVVLGIVDVDVGIGIFVSNFGWYDVLFCDFVFVCFGFFVVFDYDVCVVSWVECWFGGVCDYVDVVVFVIGIGIVGVFFVGGVFYMVGGYVGEIGYLFIVDGFVCVCGVCGCLEVVVLVGVIVCCYCEVIGIILEGVKDVIVRVVVGDEVVVEIWNFVFDVFMMFLVQFMVVVVLQVVVIGGGLFCVGGVLFDELCLWFVVWFSFYCILVFVLVQFFGNVGLFGVVLCVREFI